MAKHDSHLPCHIENSFFTLGTIQFNKACELLKISTDEKERMRFLSSDFGQMVSRYNTWVMVRAYDDTAAQIELQAVVKKLQSNLRIMNQNFVFQVLITDKDSCAKILFETISAFVKEINSISKIGETMKKDSTKYSDITPIEKMIFSDLVKIYICYRQENQSSAFSQFHTGKIKNMTDPEGPFIAFAEHVLCALGIPNAHGKAWTREALSQRLKRLRGQMRQK